MHTRNQGTNNVAAIVAYNELRDGWSIRRKRLRKIIRNCPPPFDILLFYDVTIEFSCFFLVLCHLVNFWDRCKYLHVVSERRELCQLSPES